MKLPCWLMKRVGVAKYVKTEESLDKAREKGQLKKGEKVSTQSPLARPRLMLQHM
jgi:hypothetical protein